MKYLSPMHVNILRQYVLNVPETISEEQEERYRQILSSKLWPLAQEVAYLFHTMGRPLYACGFTRLTHNESSFDESVHLVTKQGFPLVRLEYIEQGSKRNFSLATPYVHLKKRGDKHRLTSTRHTYLVNVFRPFVPNVIEVFGGQEPGVVPHVLHSGVINKIDEEIEGILTTDREALSLVGVKALLDVAAGKVDMLDLKEEVRLRAEEVRRTLDQDEDIKKQALGRVNTFFSTPKWHVVVVAVNPNRILGYMIGSYKARYDAVHDEVVLDWLSPFRMYGRIDTFIESGEEGQDLLLSIKNVGMAVERVRRDTPEKIPAIFTNASKTEYGRMLTYGSFVLEQDGFLARRQALDSHVKELGVKYYQHLVYDRGIQ